MPSTQSRAPTPPSTRLAGCFADGFAMGGNEPVMFCVHDAKLGEVSILHGTDEVVVKDPQLVRRILHAAVAAEPVRGNHVVTP